MEENKGLAKTKEKQFDVALQSKLQNKHQRLEYYKRRYTRAYSIFTQWISLLQVCQHYCVPHRDLFYYTNYTQGAQKNGKVYDTTAVAAMRTFVSKIQRALTPPQQNWALFEAGSAIEDEEDREEVNKYLEKITRIFFDYLRISNFDLVATEFYYDLGIGTGTIAFNEGTDTNPFHFFAIPLAQLAFEESVNGRVESSYRTWGEVRISEVQIMWPNANLPQWMLQQLLQDPNATVKQLYEGVIYVHGEKEPFHYVVWIDSDILLDETEKTSKWITGRWSKVNNEVMGRGVAMDALPSILSLNEIARLELMAANMNICKPYMAYSDGVFNPWTFQLSANTIIPVARGNAGEWPIAAMPDVANPAFMQLTSADLRQQINKLMFADPLGNPKDTPGRTAYEMSVRQNNLLEEIEPIFIRLQQELLGPIVERGIDILQRKGLIEKLEINGKEIQVKYKSPIVVAQGYKNVQNFLNWHQQVASVVGPENAIMYINPIELPMWMADEMSVPNKLLATREGLKQTFQAQSNMMQQQQLGALNEQGIQTTPA